MNERRGLAAYYLPSPPLRELIWVTAASFLLLIGIGFALAYVRPGSLDPLLVQFTGAAAEIGLYQVTGWHLMLTILSNNFLALLLAIALGMIPFLHLPALVLGFNSLLIGALGAYYLRSGRGLAAYLAGTLPHGIAEGAALVLSCAAGLYVCRATTWSLAGRVDAKTVARVLSEGLRCFTRWVVPLAVLSSLLEAFVTPLLFSRFL
ncbi:MAG: stage II sporulation protein M [Oscillospiraceae bacterium]|nr:stage II sporulation protein M [Oscillospiraceae bacterium]